jgi:hypothetical protein
MIRTTPLINSTKADRSRVPTITFETPRAIISMPIKNITEPK